MQTTDAHAHFWDLDKLQYPWLREVPPINKSFGLTDYYEATKGIPVRHIIFVQCECLPGQYLTEIDYVTQLAATDSRIRGIVAYFPLEAADAAEKLEAIIKNKLIRGIRRLEEEPVPLYSNPAFVAGLQRLQEHDLCFDLGVKAHQLPAAVQLVQTKPDIRYMLDHFGKPEIRKGAFDQWKQQMKALSRNGNVYCKLSGLVTEADWHSWTIDDLKPYFETVLECFGSHRVVFGGDWPVVSLASSYRQWFDTAVRLCAALSPAEQDRIFCRNALDFYRIDTTHEQLSLVGGV